MAAHLSPQPSAPPLEDIQWKHFRLEPSAPPAHWADEPHKPALSVPARWVLFTPAAMLGCLAVMLWELEVNAVESGGVRGPSCYYSVAILGRAFCAASLRKNLMLGPSQKVLLDMGAVFGDRIVDQGEFWRLFTGMWLHAGVVHLALNMLALLGLGRHLERVHGVWCVGAIYLLSGLFGSLATAIFRPSGLSVGASGAVFGLIGAVVGDIFMNWDMYSHPFRSLCWVCFVAALQLLFGTMPRIDNFAHTFGFVMGLASSAMLLTRLNPGARCWHTCSRRCFRLIASVCVCAGLLAGIAILYRIVGVDVDEICPHCSWISCKEFPWGCQANGQKCLWTCDEEKTIQCMGTPLRLDKDSATGYVDLTCPTGGGNSNMIRVGPLDLSTWDQDLLRHMCMDHC